MQKLYKYFKYIASVLLGGVSLLAAPDEASAFCRTTTTGSQPVPDQCPTAGLPLAWPAGCAALSLDPTLLPEGYSADALSLEIGTALDKWNSISCVGSQDAGAADALAPRSRFALVPFGRCPDGVRFDPRGRNANTVSFRSSWADTPSFPPGAIAVTVVSFAPSTGRILDTDVVFNLRAPSNPEGFVFDPAASADPQYRELQAVLAHEVGHVLGLAHSDVRASLMTAVYNRVAPVRAPLEDDRVGACAIYPEGRSFAACDPGREHRCAPGCQCAAPGAHTINHRSTLVLLGLSALAVLGGLNARRSARSRQRPSRAP